MTQVLLVLALAIPLAYSPLNLPFGFDDAFALKRTLLEIGALSLLCIYFIRLKFPLSILQVPLKVLMPILYVGYLGLHTLFVRQASISAQKFYEAVCLLVIFLCATHVFREEKNSMRLLQCLSLGGVVAAVWGITQAWAGSEPYSTLGNRNFFATYMLFALPPGIHFFVLSLREKRAAKVLFYGVAIAAALAALVLCKSKAAWLGLAVAGFLVLGLRKKFWACVLILVAGAIAVSFAPVESVVTELSRDVRPYLWQGALDMGLASPWFGKGLGLFFICIPFYRSPEYFLMDKSADTSLHAHNEYLEIFAQSGLIGLILFAALVFVILRDLISRAMRKDAYGIPLVLFSTLAAVLIKSFFDMDLRTANGAFLFWMVLGMSCFEGRVSEQVQSPARARWIFKSTGVLLVAYLFWAYTLPMARAEFLMKTAGTQEANGNWDAAKRYYECAMRLEPGFPEIPFRLGYACIRTGQWNDALKAYALVRSVAPFYSDVVFNMAAVYRQTGDYALAMHYLEEGFQKNPYSLQGHDIAREIFALKGDVEKSRREEILIQSLSTIKKHK